MSVPAWRHAATLMIATRTGNEMRKTLGKTALNSATLTSLHGTMLSDQSYKLLMLKRTKSMGAWPNCYVYPGGVVNKADFSSKWWDIFKRRGPTGVADVSTVVGKVAEPRPSVLQASAYIYTDESANDSQKLPPEVALRLTAIRETFEECGVLLARPNAVDLQEPTTTLQVPDTKQWQERIQNNPSLLMQLCLELDCCPDVWALHEWSVWLTPVRLKSRFETIFFICTLNEKPEVLYSPNEVTNHLWCSPLKFLASYAEKEIWMPPPQIYELSRLLNLAELDLLEEFAKKRKSNELVTMFPVQAHTRDGMLHILPGDDLYPKDPDFLNDAPAMTFNHSMLELEDDALYLNRINFNDDNTWKLICNVELRDKHKKPISLKGCLLASHL